MNAVAPLAHPVPRAATAPSAPFPYGFLARWGGGWAVVGGVVALGIVFTRGAADLQPVLTLSLLFAEVVGFTALASARLVFPLFQKLSLGSRLALQVLTVFSGTLFGSAAILATQPLFALARPRVVAMIVLINGVLAIAVGLAIHTYESMRRQIEVSYFELRRKEALERELEIAREVQHELLPKGAPVVRGLELSGVCLPAVGVGGDYYDFIPVGQDRLGLVIADVSGKGVPAALLMAGLQASVRSLAPYTIPPREVTTRLNEMLSRSGVGSRYATLFFGLYDGASRSLHYSNAGHLAPLLVGNGRSLRLTMGGIPIGMFEHAQYRDATCTLEPGDLLVLYTDGIVETPGPGGEFGEPRLLELLLRHGDLSLADLMRKILDERSRWGDGSDPHDDVTLVLARAT